MNLSQSSSVVFSMIVTAACMASGTDSAVTDVDLHDPNGDPCIPQGGVNGDGGIDNSDPINLSSGGFQHTQTDLFIPGRGLNFAITRKYRSYGGLQAYFEFNGQSDGWGSELINPNVHNPIGQHWDFNYNMRVSFPETTFDTIVIDPSLPLDPIIPSQHLPQTINVMTGDGRIELFEKYEPSGIYGTPDPALYSNSKYQWQVSYTAGENPVFVTDTSLTVFEFFPAYTATHTNTTSSVTTLPYAGRLKSITDRNGNQITFSWQTSSTGVERIDYADDTLSHRIDFIYHDEQYNGADSPTALISGIADREQLIWVIKDVDGGRAFQYDYSFNSGFPMLESVTTPSIENTNDFPLPTEHERFPTGKTWSYAYDDDYRLGAWQGRMLTTVTSPNGDVITENEYDYIYTGILDLDRNDGRVKRQKHGNAYYNYIVTDPDGSIDLPGHGEIFEDYFVWVNDRRGAITRFKYAGGNNSSAIHRQLLEKTEFEGFSSDANRQVWASGSEVEGYTWYYINEFGGTNTFAGLVDANGNPTSGEYTRYWDMNANWDSVSSTSPNEDKLLRDRIDSAITSNPLKWGAITQSTVVPNDGSPSITQKWRYDSPLSGSGCGCGSSGFESAHQDGKGYVTVKEYDPANGDLLEIYYDLPSTVDIDALPANPENIAAANDSYTYNQYGQVVTHKHPAKIMASGISIRQEDLYVYYTNTSDVANYGRLHKVHVDVNGFNIVTTYEYDVAGNMVKKIEPDGDITLYLYNQGAEVIRMQRYDLNETTLFAQIDFFYDANGNLVREEVMDIDGDQQFAGSITTVNEYDDLDFKTSSSREAGVFTGPILEEIGGSGRFIAPVLDNAFITQKWVYDGGKNLIEFQNGESVNGVGVNQTDNIVEYEYDARDLMITKVQGGSSASVLITAYEYDENGRQIKAIVDPDGTLQSQTTEFAYDAFNRVVTRTDPKNNQYQYEYDKNHNEVSIKVLGPVDEDTNDPLDNVVLAEVSRTYGVLDLRETQSVVIFDYNYISGDPNTASAPQITSYVYNEDSSVRTVTSPSGNGTPFERNLYYDTVSRIEFQEDIAGNITQYEYDVDSNITKMMQTDISSLDSSVEVFEVLYEYDPLDRRVAVVDGVGNRTETKYDSRSNVLEQKDARNKISAYTYDSLSRQLTTSLGNGTVTAAKAYDASNRLISETDHNGNETKYEYDSLNRVVKIIMPDGEFYQAQYDANGNMSQYTDARGVIVTQTFDSNNRITHRGISGTSIPGTTGEDYTYDGFGRLRKAQNDFSRITREYDSRSNIVRELQNIDAAGNFPAASDREVAYEFDLANNTTKLSYPGGRDVYRTFDELNRLAGIFNDDLFANPITEFVYSGRRLQRREHGNGTRTDYTYNGIDGVANASGDFGFGRVAGISTTKVSSSTVLDEFAFAWDKTQNRTVYDDTGSGMKNRRERSFGYDGANRLVSTDVDFPEPSTDFTPPTNNGITTYTLDGVYNRTDVSGFESNGAPIGSYSQQTGTYASNNQYNLTPREAGGEWTYLYDENGNMILKAQNSIADLTDDFVINNFDVSAFTAAYSNGDPSADFNDDGSVNFFDVSAFMLAYNAVSGNELEHWHYTYDFRNQLVGVSERLGLNVVSTVTSTYDPAARRVIESADADGDGTDDTARQFIYGCASLWEVIEQIDIGTDTTIMTHVYGLGIDDEISYQYEDQSVLKDIWTHRDDLNSLTSITDSNGDVQERYEYGDYGKVTFFDEAGVSLPSSSFNAQHLYTGRSMIGGTGLYDYRFRVMDPEMGVFNQRDPLGHIDSMNVYVYVASNSMGFVDSNGAGKKSRYTLWMFDTFYDGLTDPHDPEGIFWTYTVVVTNCAGEKLYLTFSGQSQNTKKFANSLDNKELSYLEVSAHHSNNGVWGLAREEGQCSDSEFANNIHLTDGAVVNLHMCNSENLANEILNNNEDSGDLEIVYTDGDDLYRDDNNTDYTPGGRRNRSYTPPQRP